MSGISNSEYDQFRFFLVSFISSSPRGDPWEEDLDSLLGEPKPIFVLQAINVGLEFFLAVLIALEIC